MSRSKGFGLARPRATAKLGARRRPSDELGPRVSFLCHLTHVPGNCGLMLITGRRAAPGTRTAVLLNLRHLKGSGKLMPPVKQRNGLRAGRASTRALPGSPPKRAKFDNLVCRDGNREALQVGAEITGKQRPPYLPKGRLPCALCRGDPPGGRVSVSVGVPSDFGTTREGKRLQYSSHPSRGTAFCAPREQKAGSGPALRWASERGRWGAARVPGCLPPGAYTCDTEARPQGFGAGSRHAVVRCSALGNAA